MMSVAISKKVPKNASKIYDFLLFFKRPMCLKHSKYDIRMTFSLLVNDPDKYAKQLQKHIKKPTKIHQKTVLVATKMESRKQSANMYQKIRETVENGLPNGSPFWDTFWPSGLLCCPRQALGAKLTPKTFPRIPGTSLSLNFHRFSVNLNGFCDDLSCHVGYFLFSLPS